MDLEIGTARPEDLLGVLSLVHDAYEQYIVRIGRRPTPMLEDYPAVIADRRAIVVRRGAVVVGLLVTSVHADHLLVENVAVASDERRSGIGARLLDLANSHALACGIPEVRLDTNEKMYENLTYYPRRGFLETDRRVQDGLARVFFARPVTPAES